MRRHRIFVVGLAGVGKTTLSKRLAEVLGECCLNTGEELCSYLRHQHMDVNDAADIGHTFLETFDENTVSEVILSRVNSTGAQVVDGARLFSTLTYFEAAGIEVDVLYIHAEENIRRARFCERVIRQGEVKNLESADKLLVRKDVWGVDLDRFTRVSRWRFDNSGSMKALLAFADDVAKELTSGDTAL